MFGFDHEKSIPSLIFAVVMLGVGLIPLLSHYGVISWNVAVLTTGFGGFMAYILAGGALFLVIDAFMIQLDEHIGVFTILIGIILLVIGLLPILGVGIPFINNILTPLVYQYAFTLEGVILFIDSFNMG